MAKRRLVLTWAGSTMGALSVPLAAAMAETVVARCRELVALSQALVQTAQSGRGPATRFRIDVVHFRESLRALMQDDARQPQPERLPRTLLMEMVRMVALLQAAADCQTGRYIVCPADLIERLNRQQTIVGDAAARSLTTGG